MKVRSRSAIWKTSKRTQWIINSWAILAGIETLHLPRADPGWVGYLVRPYRPARASMHTLPRHRALVGSDYEDLICRRASGAGCGNHSFAYAELHFPGS